MKKLLVLFVIGLLAFSPQANAAIALHGTAVAAANTDGLVDLTENIMIGSGSNLVLFCATLVDTTTDRNPTCSSSLDGALTLIGEVVGSATNQACAVFYKVNPTVGTHTLTHGSDNAMVNDFIMGFGVVLSGVDQSTPYDGVQTQGGSRTDLSLTIVTASGDWVIDFGAQNSNATATIGANQTAIASSPLNTGGSAGSNYMSSTQLGSDGGSMTWTWTGSQRTAHVAFNVNEAGGGGGGAAVPVVSPFLIGL